MGKLGDEVHGPGNVAYWPFRELAKSSQAKVIITDGTSPIMVPATIDSTPVPVEEPAPHPTRSSANPIRAATE